MRLTLTPLDREPARAWLVGLAAALLAGCASNHGQHVAFVRDTEADVSTGSYVVQPPDVLVVHSPSAPEVDGAHQMVRPDGKIVLRLLGEIDVAGLTTGEVADKLKTLLARYYVDPEVVVQVAGYNSQFYFIFGEVSHPGPVRFTGRDTVLMALAQARPNFFAWRSNIRLMRPSRNGEASKTIIIDLDKMLAEGEMASNVLLQEGDVIEVPPTPLAWAGHRMRELFYPVEPVIQAYTGPASTIQATDNYMNGVDSGDDDDDGDGFRRRFGR